MLCGLDRVAALACGLDRAAALALSAAACLFVSAGASAAANAAAAPTAFWAQPTPFDTPCGAPIAGFLAPNATVACGNTGNISDAIVKTIVAPFDAALNLPEFSVAAWVRLDEVASTQVVLSSFDEASTAGYQLRCVAEPATGEACRWELSAAARGDGLDGAVAVFAASAGAPATADAWTHLTAVVSHGAAKIFVSEGNATAEAAKDEVPLIAPFTDDAATGDTIDITAFSFTPNAQAPLTTATAVAELAFFDYGLSDEQAAALGASAPPDAAPAPDAALPGDSPAAPIAIALSDAAGNAAVFTDSRDTRAYADSFAAPGCEFADNAHASPDVIYRLAPDADATVAVTVCSVPSPNGGGEPAFDAAVYVLEVPTTGDADSPISELAVAACSDDPADPVAACPGGFAAEVRYLPVKADSEYLIVVDGFGAGESGAYTLSVAELAEPSEPGVPFVGSADSIFADGLSNGWADRSARAQLTTRAFEPVYTGTAALEADMGAYGAARLRALDGGASQRATIGMWVRLAPDVAIADPNVGAGAYAVLAGDGANAPAPIQVPLEGLVTSPDEWTYVRLALADHAEPAASGFLSDDARYTLLTFVSTNGEPFPFLVDDVIAIEPASQPLAAAPLLVAPPTEPTTGAATDSPTSGVFATALVFAERLLGRYFVTSSTAGVTLELEAEGMAKSGATALKATNMQPGAAVVFAPTAAFGEGVPLTGLLLLWVSAKPEALATLAVSANGVTQPLTTYLSTDTDGTYQLASVPLANFRGASGSAATTTPALAITNAAASDVISEVLLDDIVLATAAPQERYDASASAPPAPPAQREAFDVAQVLYGDTLAAGWADASWSAEVDFSNTAVTAAGSPYAIAVQTTSPNGAFSISTANDTFSEAGGVAAVDFDVFVSGAASAADGTLEGLTVELENAATAEPRLSSGTLPLAALLVDPAGSGSGWRRARIDLSELAIDGVDNSLAGVAWARLTLQSASPRAFAIDNINLMRSAGFTPVAPVLPPGVDEDLAAGTPSPAPESPPADGDDGGLSTGAIVGIVVGCVCAVAIAAAVAVVVNRRRQTAALAAIASSAGAGPSRTISVRTEGPSEITTEV